MIDTHRFSHLLFDIQSCKKCMNINIKDFDEVYFILISEKLHLMPNMKDN